MGLRTKQRSRTYGITTEKNPNKEKRTFYAKHSSAQNFCTKTPPIDAAGGSAFSVAHLSLQTRKTNTLPQKQKRRFFLKKRQFEHKMLDNLDHFKPMVKRAHI